MDLQKLQQQGLISNNKVSTIFLFLVVTVLTANLNAIVDFFLHPHIPYFHAAHLIVGGITGFVSMIVFGLLIIYAQYLEILLSKIKALESILPICTICKKIRKPDADPDKKESWQAIDSYITEKTTTMFSHSICPDCAALFYPEYMNDD